MLSTTLDLNANPFIAMLRRVDGAVAGFHGRIVSVGAAFTGIQAAAQLVGNAFSKLTSSFELAGKLTDLSEATGESKGDLLILGQAFKNVGKSADEVGGFVSKLHKAIGGLNEEGKSTTAAFGELKTSAEELRALPLLDQFKRLSEGFAGIDDRARRGQAAMNLFGKSGEEMLAIFRDPEALSQARIQVGGLVDTIETAAPAMDKIGDAVGAVSNKFDQLVTGALAVSGNQFATFADALNAIDLTNIGKAIGHVATLATWFVKLNDAVTGFSSILKIFDVLKDPLGTGGPTPKGLKSANIFESASAAAATSSSLGVGSMTSRGLNAYTGFASMSVDPVTTRIDRTNNLLEQVRDAVRGNGSKTQQPRPDLPV